ncbi:MULTISPECIES: DUF4920 domain-containing protein [unclassified Imperialibacter]|uniref:DUF4920 domain-containing protein n=1 Tax=unclassified Imperialibacter TaxID=2629706 RepID=UPI001258CBBF|nr:MULTISPECIES: DUF4920 domain-containing protein [unclassified Imperialibacter]CAD5280911.1 conserved hypothetical protein [Imperialibacter sp. 75]CAD5287471.1 conserved hypothetical protein [Imperialibacter sp. 89]VVT27823.1 conserved hypothetical protein [Imperialibacter sp. EC-SDR9]
MRKLFYIGISALLLTACQQKEVKNEQAVVAEEAVYESFGATISDDQAAPVAELIAMPGDSAYTKVRGTIVEVCQAKGCWMKLDLGNNETMRVTFKDYGFFVPKDAKGREVVIEGVALKSLTPVEELQHYAKDAGKTAEEIAAIIEPVQELSFEAVGVLMR